MSVRKAPQMKSAHTWSPFPCTEVLGYSLLGRMDIMCIVFHFIWFFILDLSREAVDAPSLGVLKASLNGALGNLIRWGWGRMIFEVPSNPSNSMIHSTVL